MLYTKRVIAKMKHNIQNVKAGALLWSKCRHELQCLRNLGYKNFSLIPNSNVKKLQCRDFHMLFNHLKSMHKFSPGWAN